MQLTYWARNSLKGLLMGKKYLMGVSHILWRGGFTIRSLNGFCFALLWRELIGCWVYTSLSYLEGFWGKFGTYIPIKYLSTLLISQNLLNHLRGWGEIKELLRRRLFYTSYVMWLNNNYLIYLIYSSSLS